MACERLWRLMLVRCWERRIGFRLNVVARALDPVKEISLRLFPNDHLEALYQQVTSYRSLAWPFTPVFGFRLPTGGV